MRQRTAEPPHDRTAAARRHRLPPSDELERDTDIFDLGVDSLDFWNILMDVEDRAGAEVPGEVLDRLAQLDSQVTVGDLLDAMGSWEPIGGPGPP